MNNKKILSIISLVLSAIFIALGVIVLPAVSNFGNFLLLYVVALIISLYVFCYLFKLVTKYTGIKQILIVIEMVLDIVIIVVLLLSSFIDFITVNESFRVIGLVIMLHGIFSLMGGYFKMKEGVDQYKLKTMIFDIILVSFGMLLLISKFFSNIFMIYVISILCYLISIFSLIYGIVLIKKRN